MVILSGSPPSRPNKLVILSPIDLTRGLCPRAVASAIATLSPLLNQLILGLGPPYNNFSSGALRARLPPQQTCGKLILYLYNRSALFGRSASGKRENPNAGTPSRSSLHFWLRRSPCRRRLSRYCRHGAHRRSSACQALQLVVRVSRRHIVRVLRLAIPIGTAKTLALRYAAQLIALPCSSTTRVTSCCSICAQTLNHLVRRGRSLLQRRGRSSFVSLYTRGARSCCGYCVAAAGPAGGCSLRARKHGRAAGGRCPSTCAASSAVGCSRSAWWLASSWQYGGFIMAFVRFPHTVGVEAQVLL